jgi:hypothetical protein
MKLSNLKRRKEKDSKNITIGVLGCMAERLKTKLLESDRLVDVVVGPDAYRDLPRLISTLVEDGILLLLFFVFLLFFLLLFSSFSWFYPYLYPFPLPVFSPSPQRILLQINNKRPSTFCFQQMKHMQTSHPSELQTPSVLSYQ